MTTISNHYPHITTDRGNGLSSPIEFDVYSLDLFGVRDYFRFVFRLIFWDDGVVLTGETPDRCCHAVHNRKQMWYLNERPFTMLLQCLYSNYAHVISRQIAPVYLCRLLATKLIFKKIFISQQVSLSSNHLWRFSQLAETKFFIHGLVF